MGDYLGLFSWCQMGAQPSLRTTEGDFIRTQEACERGRDSESHGHQQKKAGAHRCRKRQGVNPLQTLEGIQLH